MRHQCRFLQFVLRILFICFIRMLNLVFFPTLLSPQMVVSDNICIITALRNQLHISKRTLNSWNLRPLRVPPYTYRIIVTHIQMKLSVVHGQPELFTCISSCKPRHVHISPHFTDGVQWQKEVKNFCIFVPFLSGRAGIQTQPGYNHTWKTRD